METSRRGRVETIRGKTMPTRPFLKEALKGCSQSRGEVFSVVKTVTERIRVPFYRLGGK